MIVDSHCHLDDEKFADDRDAVIERARAAGITAMLAIGTGEGPPDLEAAIRLAEKYPFIYATVGVHPHDAARANEDTFIMIEMLATHPKVVAIGEIGLDYYYDFSPRDVQRDVFIKQAEIAKRVEKPVVIHSRDAWDETIRILKEHSDGRGIMHCFSGGEAEAAQALELGFHLSFGGVLTFPKADAVRRAAQATPEDRLLIETDCPYLAPVPHRGKRNEPAFMMHTIERLSEIRGCPVEQLAQATTRNFERLCLRGASASE
jgi:TatD DNase family protein